MQKNILARILWRSPIVDPDKNKKIEVGVNMYNRWKRTPRKALNRKLRREWDQRRG